MGTTVSRGMFTTVTWWRPGEICTIIRVSDTASPESLPTCQ